MSATNKRSKTSPLWSFFTVNEEANKVAKCDICSQKICYRSSITNMKKHLERKRLTINLQVPVNPPVETIQDPDEPSATIIDSATPSTSRSVHLNQPRQLNIASFLPRKINETQKKKLDNILIKLLILDFQPFSIVEDHGFVEFLQNLNPSYKLPSRKAVTSCLLPAAYEQCMNVVQQKLRSVISVCLTTDCWTSKNNESYLAVTAHYIREEFELNSILLECTQLDGPHTSSNLATGIRSIIDKFNLSEKVLIIVTDNASNIKNAVMQLGCKHFGCYAHTLNLIVQEALKEVRQLQDKIKTLVAHFKRSSTSTQKLSNYQKNSGPQVPKKLVQDVPTRWNSTFYMLCRLVELKDPVKATTALINKDLPILSEEEWTICSELCIVLKPFEEVTSKLSGVNYVTSSQVIVLTRGLASVCRKLLREDFSSTVRAVLQVLQQGVSTRFHNIEHSKTVSLCSFLDPRFKMIGFSEQNAAESVKKIAIELVTQKLNQKRQTRTEAAEPSNPSMEESKFSVWEDFDKVVATTQPQGTAMSGATAEVQRFVEDSIFPRHHDPLLWWREHCHTYPTLAELVRERFSAM